MSTIITDSKNYKAIADKIRERSEKDALLFPSDMPNGIREVYENGKQKFGLRDTVVCAGSVRADYVNPMEHPVRVNITSNNLLQFNNLTSSVTNGLSASIENGVATITGEFTGADSKVFDRNFVKCTNYGDFATIMEERSFILPKGTYTLSLTGTDNSIDHIVNICLAYGEIGHYMQDKSGLAFYVFANIDSPTTFIVKEDCYCQFMFHVYRLTTEPTAFTIDAVVKPQLQKGTNATSFTPYVDIDDLSTVKVTRCGKNLFDISSTLGFQSQYTGLSNTVTDSKLIVVCSVTARAGYLDLGVLQAGTYTVRVGGFDNRTKVIYVGADLLSLTATNYKSATESLTFTLTETNRVWMSGSTFRNTESPYTLSNIQLEFGTTATEYEPYIEPITYTANADGIVDGVTSLYPCMTLVASDSAVAVEAAYYTDIASKIQALSDTILELGGEL